MEISQVILVFLSSVMQGFIVLLSYFPILTN